MKPGTKQSGIVRKLAALSVLAATGAAVVVFVSSGGRGTASAETSLQDFVSIKRVTPNVVLPTPQRNASRGVFTVDCGTNGNGKFSPDNPVAQPGIKNGAEHVHDFVGNLAITADTSDEDLAASGTTCKNGDRSAYFWPVVRIDENVRAEQADTDAALANTTPTVSCPSVADRLPAVPSSAAGQVQSLLAKLDKLTAAANARLAASKGQIDADFNNSVLDPLRTQRTAIIKQISRVMSWNGRKPAGLVSTVECEVSYDGLHAGHTAASAKASVATPAPSASAAAPPADPSGPDLELPNNTGGIVRPASVRIEYRGNATSKVVPMPKFLRALTGDAKPTSRGPANARATWTCSGFADRLSDKYPICPAGSQVMRVQDFPGCWDGKNIDSENHRSHLAFADKTSGACPAGFVAIPQLRISISYNIPREVQDRGQFALDSFPEENHNPFSDHNDFINVNSTRQMKAIAACINAGRRNS